MCGGNSFGTVIDFGKNPLVNSLVDEKDLDKTESVFPLVVKRCRDCSLVQIVNNIDSHKIYKDVDYLFFSSDMPTLKEYFFDMAKEVKCYMQPHDFIVEIGSNDGVFLQHFRDEGAYYKILGVDPATNVAIRAMARKAIPTLPLFFSERLAKLIASEYGKAKVIAGSNCIAHLNDLHDLMRGVDVLLDENGVFVVECNYWGGMVKNTNYALIYHDHFSYFTVQNWVSFLEQFGMTVFDAWVTPAQGGSLRMFIDRKKRARTERCTALLNEERETKLNTQRTATTYRKDVLSKADRLNELITKLKSEGRTIAGYGAAAKGLSILKMARIGKAHLDYFVDDSPAKQGKYTPVEHIPVISRDEAVKRGLPDYFFITAPNYAAVIIAKEQEFLKNGGKFILEDGEIVG